MRGLRYSGVIMSAMASQINGVSIVYWTVCSGADQRKHQSSEWLAFVKRIHRWPVNSPRKGPVTPEVFPFDDVSVEPGAVEPYIPWNMHMVMTWWWWWLMTMTMTMVMMCFGYITSSYRIHIYLSMFPRAIWLMQYKSIWLRWVFIWKDVDQYPWLYMTSLWQG